MTYSNALKLFSSAPKESPGSAERLRALLDYLGAPDRRLQLIPVTGEKGKSSVVRMLSSMMAKSGIGVGALIYPCLATPKDNVSVNGSTLTNEAFVRYSSTLSDAIRLVRVKHPELYHLSTAGDYTGDELLFCLALLAAADAGVKWMILEIPNTPFSPLSLARFSSSLTVITSCGPQLPPNVSKMIYRGLGEVVSARLPFSSSYTALSSACARAGCRLTIPVFSAVSVTEASLKRTVFTYRGRRYLIPLYGEFAVSNALCALEAAAALRRLGCPMTDAGDTAGLSTSSLPARAEILSVSPTVLCDAACDAFSFDALSSLLERKGAAIGDRVILCIEEGTSPPPILSRITNAGFTLSETVYVKSGKENRTAVLLLKAASHGDLILAIGSLPFAFTMRTEFSKVLCSM